MPTPQLGDVIFAKRRLYNHYGIYVSDNEVIHYYLDSESILGKIKDTATCNGVITDTTYKVFHAGDPVYICRFNELTMNTLLLHSLLRDKISFWELLLDLLGMVFPPLKLIRAYFRKHNDTFSEEHRGAKHVLSPEETVELARQSRGKRNYSLWGNNCEHFAIWCKTGVKDCMQKQKIREIIEKYAFKAD